MVELTGIHLLLTYKCDGECDHCFLWCSPGSKGTMSRAQVERILSQAGEMPSIKDVFFEGGEPFLFYPVLTKGIELARARGYEVGVVSNAFWATDENDSLVWLEPLADDGRTSLSLSIDEYHGGVEEKRNVRRAQKAAKALGIPVGVLRVRDIRYYSCTDGGKTSDGDLYFRGRAAEKLAKKAKKKPSASLTSCPEEPPNITRVHIDAFDNVQFCQGITVGNLRRKSLKQIIESLSPEEHPIIGPLARGGPAQLAKERGVKPSRGYADACHMCYAVRKELRRRGELPRALTPDQAYGEGGESRG